MEKSNNYMKTKINDTFHFNNKSSLQNDTMGKYNMSSIATSSHHALGQVNLPPPFLSKTYDMVDDPHTNAIISWSSSNKSFVVWEPSTFSRCLLPHFFKHDNFSSFVRQLHTYGFRKVDPDRWEFANESFVRGQKHLLPTIQRRHKAAPPNLSLTKNATPSSTLPPHVNVLDELESLTKDRNSIMLEVVKLDHAHQASLQDVQSISKRLHATELLQQQMITLFAQTLSTINQIPTSRKNDHPNLPILEKRRRVDHSLKLDDCCLPSSQCIAVEKESQVIDGVKYLRQEDHMSPTPFKSMIQVDINDYEPTRESCGGKLFTKAQSPKFETRKLFDLPSSQSNIDKSRSTSTQGSKFEARKMLDLPSSQSNIDNSRLASDAIIMDDTSSPMGPLKSSHNKQELYLRAYECDTNMNNHIFYSDTLYSEDMVYPNGFLWHY